MAARVDAMDWAKTPLGPRADWPQSLSTAVGICLASPLPAFVWWGPDLINIHNDACAPVFGERSASALGQPAREVWPDVWPIIAEGVGAVMERGESVIRERVRFVLHRNGYPEETWFTVSHSPVLDERGGIGGLFQVCGDETAGVVKEQEHDRLAEERRRAEEFSRTILESVTDAFFATDREFNFTHANPQGEKLLGRKPGGLIGLNLYEEYAGIVGTAFDRMYQRAISEGKSGSATIYYPDHDRWYEAHAYPSSEGMSVFFRDVSEQQKTGTALRASEERLQALVTATSDAIYQMSPDWTEMRQLDGSDFIHSTHRPNRRWLDEYIADVDQELVKTTFTEAIRTKSMFELEHRVRTTDGSVGWTFSRAIPLLGPDGEITEWFGAATDVTARKKAEEERERRLESERAARTEAERADRMKDEFLATLSHELRTPLNAVLGWAQIMRQSNDPDDLAQGLEVIERNARAQSQIIEDLLDMSRIISGKVRLDVQRLDLSSIVQAAVEAARPASEAKGIRLTAVLDPLVGIAVSGDASRLQQVLSNLIGNAVKFTPTSGRVQVLLERVSSHLEISVIDTGEGISPDFIPHVFSRFSQADASTTRRHGGLGLGLSIVKQLVELHGGSIKVKSPGMGQGATFIVALPLIAAHPEDDEPERQHPRVAKASSLASISCGGIDGVRVVVIDDEPDARALVKRLLEGCKAVVTATGSVDEVVGLVQTGRFDVLISDIGMPGEDGYTLIGRVRRLGRDRGGDIPAIALTAYARAEDSVKAVAAGFHMHISEPVELVTMVAGAAGRTGPKGQ